MTTLGVVPMQPGHWGASIRHHRRHEEAMQPKPAAQSLSVPHGALFVPVPLRSQSVQGVEPGQTNKTQFNEAPQLLISSSLHPALQMRGGDAVMQNRLAPGHAAAGALHVSRQAFAPSAP